MTPEGGTYVVAIVSPATNHVEYLSRKGVGESLWIPGDIANAVHFVSREEAEEAAGRTRRARVGGSYLVVPIPSGSEYRVAIYTVLTGRVEGLDDEGELTPYLDSSVCDNELGAAEFANLVRDLRLGELYRVDVRPRFPPTVLAPVPLPLWRRLLLRLGL
jgi:hypothetical protein